MDDKGFRTWRDFNEQEYRRCGTFQLCIDDLARDLYYDERLQKRQEDEEEELNFDY